MPRKVCWADFFFVSMVTCWQLRSTVLQQKHSTRRLSTGPTVLIGWCFSLINHNHLTVSHNSNIKTTHQFSIFSQKRACSAYSLTYIYTESFYSPSFVGVERQVYCCFSILVFGYICVMCTSYVTKVSGVLWKICVSLYVPLDYNKKGKVLSRIFSIRIFCNARGYKLRSLHIWLH